MDLQLKIVSVIRFAVCLFSLITALILMIRADDNHYLRWGSCLLAAGAIWFNEPIGEALYLVLGSTLEMLYTAMGVGFTLCLGAVIMLFPIIAIVRWLTH